jgi:ABC-type transport system involved in cytochrome bd biosynthesis fused ATPase/permease subunit
VTEPQSTRRNPGLLTVAGVAVVLAVVAFLVMDVVVAAFVGIVLVTIAVMAVLASDWESHPTFEQREQRRAVRRKAKWEQNAGVRERDRRRWEAHQAQKAQPREDGDR